MEFYQKKCSKFATEQKKLNFATVSICSNGILAILTVLFSCTQFRAACVLSTPLLLSAIVRNIISKLPYAIAKRARDTR